MNTQQIGLLVMQAFACSMVLAVLGVLLLKSREQRHKYRLYELRDELLYLVASHQLSESSLVFKVFYGAINKSISVVKKLTLYSLIHASISAKTDLQKERQEKLQGAIESSNPEVRAFIDRVAKVYMEIIISNSPLLRFTLFVIRRCGQMISRIRSLVTVPKSEAYQAYRYFEHMHVVISRPRDHGFATHNDQLQLATRA